MSYGMKLMLRGLAFLVVGLGTSVLIVACSAGRVEPIAYDNVVRVFWHENDYYSILVKISTTNQLKLIDLPEVVCRVEGQPSSQQTSAITITADVPENEPMRVLGNQKIGADMDVNPCIVDLQIHVHSGADINGADWNHGKFGSGTTQVVN